MEFWGVEVKAGQPLKVKPSFDNIIHLSQASLGETKKDKGHDSAPVFVKFGDNKLVLGTLIPEKIPQLSFDLVFEKEFELSHNWKSGSIYFCGYQTPLPYDDDSEGFDMDESEEEEVEEEELTPIPAANGKGGPKVENAKAAAKAVAAKLVAAAKPNKDIKPKEDEEDDSDDSDDSMDDGFGDDDSLEMSDEEGGSDEDDDDDADDSDEEEDSDEEDVTPKKVEVGKKRPGVSATKTPVSAKKAKAGTPQSDGKKGGHVATPHPKKQGGKTPVNNKSPKSGGQHSGKSHSKSFTSNGARGSHTKAKHSGK